MEGKLIIVATGHSVDLFGPEDVVKATGVCTGPNLRFHHSMFVETYCLFDSRASTSKGNKIFCAEVSKSLSEGANIFLVVPDAGMIDKRLRERAMVLGLPGGLQRGRHE